MQRWRSTPCAAGKDIYIEKPMTYTVEEGNTLFLRRRKAGRILQVGSQGMSSRIQQKARELIASGKLGQVTMIRAYYNRNTAGGAWIYPIPPDASPTTVNWEMFLGPAPKRPWIMPAFSDGDAIRITRAALPPTCFVHLCTSIHFMMNAEDAAHVVAMGQLYRWKESRDVPDTINAILEYPEGFAANLGSTFNNQTGSEGAGSRSWAPKGSLMLGGAGLTFNPEFTVENNRWIVESWPAGLQDAYYKDPKVRSRRIARHPRARSGRGAGALPGSRIGGHRASFPQFLLFGEDAQAADGRRSGGTPGCLLRPFDQPFGSRKENGELGFI